MKPTIIRIGIFLTFLGALCFVPGLGTAAFSQTVPKNVQKATGTNYVTEDLVFNTKILTINTALVLADDVRQTFNPGATVAGLNVGSFAGDPSTPINGDLWYDSVSDELSARINGATVSLGAGGGGGAPDDATYITQTANGTLSAEQALSSLATGIVQVTTTTGVLSSVTDSAGVAALISDETGLGVLAFSASPVFSTDITLPNSATPTTATVAKAAFDTNAWATDRGAIQIHDGTANTFVVAALVSDTPSDGQVPTWNTGGTVTWETPSGGGGGAPDDATYITQTANGTLSAEQALSSLATGIVQVTTTTGVLSSVTTSAGVSGLLSDETGSGALVFGTSPTIATPVISGAITFPDGVRQSFNPDGTNAGLNVGSHTADPSTPSNGDLWYDSTANELTARINGANVALGSGGGGVATDTIFDAKGDLAVGTGSNTASKLSGGTDGDVLTYDSGESTGVKWAAPSGGGSGGTLTLVRFTANDNQAPASSFAALDTRNSILVLDFDAASDENAVFTSIIPEAADFTTGITARLQWTATSATSGDCVWVVAFERMTTDIDSDSFATGVSGTSTTNGTSGILTATAINFTGSEIDGLVAGEPFRIKVTRDADAGGDTMAGDAELISIELRQR